MSSIVDVLALFSPGIWLSSVYNGILSSWWLWVWRSWTIQHIIGLSVAIQQQAWRFGAIYRPSLTSQNFWIQFRSLVIYIYSWITILQGWQKWFKGAGVSSVFGGWWQKSEVYYFQLIRLGRAWIFALFRWLFSGVSYHLGLGFD